MHRNIAVLIGSMMVMSAAHAFDFGAVFSDPVDQRMDASQWLLSRHGFLPLPIVITEPAVGYGGGAALVFFHPDREARAKSKEFTPPSVSAVFAAATQNDTKLGGLGHLGVWRHNTVRFTGGAGAASVNLKYYGGEDHPRSSHGIAYNIEGWGAFAQVVWRLGRSNVWLGPQLIYMDATTELRGGNASVPASADLQGKVQNSGAGAVLTFDDRDNIFTPTRGLDSSWYGLQVGVDVARGPEEWAFYIQMGNGWSF